MQSNYQLHNVIICTFYYRSNSRIGEREAPDGEEEESPNRILPQAVQSPNATTTPEGHIRVPSWIGQPLVSRLTVLFKDRALSQLSQLGPEVCIYGMLNTPGGIAPVIKAF